MDEIANLEKISHMDKRLALFGCLFVLSTNLETLGDSKFCLGELTTKQWFLLLNLTTFFEPSSPPTLKQLAEAMGTSHQNAKALSLKLEKKGFLRIEKDEKDARVLRIILQKKTEQYFKGREEEDNRFVETLMSVLSHDEVNIIFGGLSKLINQTEVMRQDFMKQADE